MTINQELLTRFLEVTSDKVRDDVSVVDIIFDENLKSFISELQYVFSMKGDRLYQDKLDEEQCMREYFVNNQHRLNFTSKKYKLNLKLTKCYPTFFALQILGICDMNRCNSIDDAIKQVVETMQYFIELSENGKRDEVCIVDDNENDEWGNCCCGQSCKLGNMFWIHNEYTKRRCIIGSACIFKHNLIERKQLNAIVRGRKKKKNDKKEEERLGKLSPEEREEEERIKRCKEDKKHERESKKHERENKKKTCEKCHTVHDTVINRDIKEKVIRYCDKCFATCDKCTNPITENYRCSTRLCYTCFNSEKPNTCSYHGCNAKILEKYSRCFVHSNVIKGCQIRI